MDLIGKIEQDTKRIQNESKALLLYMLILISTSSLIGLLSREDYTELFTYFNLIPLILILLTAIAITYFKKIFFLSKNKLLFLSSIASLFIFSLLQKQTSVSLWKFKQSASFIPELYHCYLIALYVSIFVFLFSLFYFKRYLPQYSPNEYFKISFSTSTCYLIALGLHCQGAIHSHIILSHWVTAIIGSVILAFVLIRKNRKLK